MNIEFTTNLMAYIVPIISVLLIIFAIWGIKKTNKKLFKNNKWFIMLMSIILVIFLIANVAINMFKNVIDLYLTSSQVDETTLVEAQDNSKALTESIQGEGIVLLENKNNSLPLSDVKQLNVFGIGSVATVFGGSGSGASDESANVTFQEGLENADRKSTRLNSSHVSISYAVFCLKKKKEHIHLKQNQRPHQPRPHRPRLLLQIRQTDLLTLQQIQKHKERGLPNNKHKNPIARPLA